MAEQQNNIRNAALILEGGGMRGIYTTGVLDCLLDKGLFFEYIIGVSAGASHALSYLSRQKDRARRVNVEYCRRSDYMGLGCLLKEGSLFGMDLLFRRLPYELEPFDFAVFEQNASRYYAVATNMLTGKADYLAPRSAEDVLAAAQASCSLPYVSKPVYISGGPYLDGGIADSVPILRAEEEGFEKQVIILTQPKGYRKTEKNPSNARQSRKGKPSFINSLLYRRYPELVTALGSRAERYNETMDYIDRLESEGRIFVLRPEPQPGLSRLERDPEKLNGLHRSGYRDMEEHLGRLQAYLGGKA
jgi:predicted patatin/cPLA2 family phospholipase